MSRHPVTVLEFILADNGAICGINLAHLDTGIICPRPDHCLNLRISQCRQYSGVLRCLSFQRCFLLLKVQLLDNDRFPPQYSKGDDLLDGIADDRLPLVHGLSIGDTGDCEVFSRVAESVGLGDSDIIGVDIDTDYPGIFQGDEFTFRQRHAHEHSPSLVILQKAVIEGLPVFLAAR